MIEETPAVAERINKADSEDRRTALLAAAQCAERGATAEEVLEMAAVFYIEFLAARSKAFRQHLTRTIDRRDRERRTP